MTPVLGQALLTGRFAEQVSLGLGALPWQRQPGWLMPLLVLKASPSLCFLQGILRLGWG